MWNIQEYSEVGSTNALAKEQLFSGTAHHGDVIQAWHQTSGRGRFANRVWQDEPGHSLLMSLVLEQVPVSPSLMQYGAALSVITALRNIASNQDPSLETDFKLKWPNDILCNGKKVSGILSESVWHSQHLRGMIVGIGVNVTQNSFNSLLDNSAISLKQAGIMASVNEVRDTILSIFNSRLHQIATMGRTNADDYLIEQTRKELTWMLSLGPFDIVINEETVLRNMRYEGLSAHGALLLRHEDGTIEVVNAGSIEWSEQTRVIVNEVQVH